MRIIYTIMSDKNIIVHARIDNIEGIARNTLFDIPYDFSGYSCAVVGVDGRYHIGKDNIHPKGNGLFLCADIVEESYITGTKATNNATVNIKKPIIKQLPSIFTQQQIEFETSIAHLLWRPVKCPYVQDMTLYIVDEWGNIPIFKLLHIKCELLFSRHPERVV
jgi:hypothetical protein